MACAANTVSISSVREEGTDDEQVNTHRGEGVVASEGAEAIAAAEPHAVPTPAAAAAPAAAANIKLSELG